jgi:hypothetical protein
LIKKLEKLITEVNKIDRYFKYFNNTNHVPIGELKDIPVPEASKSEEIFIGNLTKKIIEFQKKLHEENPTGNEKERLEQQIKNVDYEIDQEVYNLYGITKEEQKIIEESLR